MSSSAVFVPYKVGAVELNIEGTLFEFGHGEESDTIVNTVDLTTVCASRYVYPGFSNGIEHVVRTIMSTGGRLEDFYVMGCAYYKRGVLADSQACITGKGFRGEDVVDACVREACEETGLRPRKDGLRRVANIQDGKRSHSTFVTSVRDCVPYDAASRCGGEFEDTNKRVQLIVYGTRDDFSSLGRIRQRLASADTRSIRGLMLFNLGNLVRFV
jgi:hypothetical protein